MLYNTCLTVYVGRSDVERLYWLLHNNRTWLHGQLDMKHVLPLVETDPILDTFILDVMPRPLPQFNPLEEHQRIGPYKFDHVSRLYKKI